MSADESENLFAVLDGIKSVKQLATTVIERELKRQASSSGLIGLSSSIEDYDMITDGIEPGDLILIASPPGAGKSSIALQICAHIATSEGRPVAMFIYDQSANNVFTRLVVNHENIDINRLRYSIPEEYSKFENGVSKLADAPLFIEAPCQQTFEDLLKKCRVLKNVIPELSLILVDDIQGFLKFANADTDGAVISNSLKDLAIETQTAIIACSQFSQDAELREDKRPTLRDLRQWGKLEQSADVVCGIYKESYYNPNSPNPYLMEIDILKNTKGNLTSFEVISLKY